MIIKLKHLYHSILVLALVFSLTFLLPLGSPSSDDVDRKLLKAIESKTGFAPADYLFGSIALSTPFIEGGVTLKLLRDDDGLPLASSLLLTQITCLSIKYIIDRPRPNIRRYKPRLWNTRITPSFPSGHTASSFAFATFISSRYPRYRPYLWLYACLSGFSQIYVGNHYPSDVLVGALLGYAVARITNGLFERFR